MAVWLTHGPRTVGLDHGLIRAADFAHLVEAQAILDAARAEAEALVEKARREHAAAYQRGFEQGLERGLRDAAARWAGQALDTADATRRNLQRQSERLSSLVSMAVERVIDEGDRSALFRRSLRAVMKLVQDLPMLTMRVHVDDLSHARAAVEEVLAQSGSAMSIEVVSDAALAPGACRFESDDGVVDASLDTQLEALRRAVHRAAQQMAGPADGPEPDGEQEDCLELP